MAQNNIKISRMFPIKHKSTRAFVDVQYGDLIIKGFRVVEREDKSLFVSMPSAFDEKQERFFPTVVSMRDETKSAIDKFVLKAWEESLKTKKTPAKSKPISKRGRPKGSKNKSQ